jgi:hypothetical protein
MRRPVPTVPISPTQLKHFAAATVAMTIILALFASGDGAGLGEDLQERGAQNQLAQTEASQHGAHKLKANLKFKNSSKSQFAFSEGGDGAAASAGWGSGGGGGGPRAAGRETKDASVQRMPRKAGESATLSGPDGVPDHAKPESLRAKKAPPKKVEAKPVSEPTEQELDKAMEASRQRSGSAEREED